MTAKDRAMRRTESVARIAQKKKRTYLQGPDNNKKDTAQNQELPERNPSSRIKIHCHSTSESKNTG